MKFKFKPEDFEFIEVHDWSGIKMRELKITKAVQFLIAEKANVLLGGHLKTLPRVYGKAETYKSVEASVYTELECPGDTHTALLWGVEEIENKR